MINNINQTVASTSFGASLKIVDLNYKFTRLFPKQEFPLVESEFAKKTANVEGDFQYIARFSSSYVPDTISYRNGDYFDSIDVSLENNKPKRSKDFLDKLINVVGVFKQREAARKKVGELVDQINKITGATNDFTNKVLKENFSHYLNHNIKIERQTNE